MSDREALLRRCTTAGGSLLVDGRAPTGDEMVLLLAVPDDLVSSTAEAYGSAVGNGLGPSHRLRDLAELTELLRLLTGGTEDLDELLHAALEIDPPELDRRIGALDLDSQDALAELVAGFPRVAADLPGLRMLANHLHGDDCPCWAEATARHIERLLLVRSARTEPSHPLPDDALAWLEDRVIRF